MDFLHQKLMKVEKKVDEILIFSASLCDDINDCKCFCCGSSLWLVLLI